MIWVIGWERISGLRALGMKCMGWKVDILIQIDWIEGSRADWDLFLGVSVLGFWC